VERPVFWALASGRAQRRSWAGQERPADVFLLKGLVEELATELGLDLHVGPADPEHPLYGSLHPNRQGTVLLDDGVVGVLGEVHPDVCERAKLKHSRPVYLEIDTTALLGEGTRPPYVEPGTTQPVVRSLAFTLPRGVESGAVAAFLHASGPAELGTVRVVDRYDHGDGDHTLTFELVFDTTEERSVSADEVNTVAEQLIEAVREQFGDQGVRLR
jgi:phenylalanyl-tRNA synthetase beta chain